MNQDLKKKWLKRIEACQNSSSSIHAFCQQNNMGTSSLYKWAKILNKPLKLLQPQNDISFIELGTVQPPVAEDTTLYPLELSTDKITMKTHIPRSQLILLIKEMM